MSNITDKNLLGGQQPNKNVVTGLISGIAIVLVVALVSVVSCRPKGSPVPSPASEAVVIIGIDRSGSTESQRPAQRIAAEAATFFADENRTVIGFYAVDKKAVPIQEPTESIGPGLSDSVLAEFTTKKQARSVGTRPLAFWREMQERYSKTTSPTFIALLSDGGNDFQGDTTEITSTLQSLAKNPNIHVAILGVASDLAIATRRDLAPFGPKRANLSIQSGKSDEEALRSDLMTFLGDLE
jgi:hypothetical protein